MKQGWIPASAGMTKWLLLEFKAPNPATSGFPVSGALDFKQ